MKLPQTYIPEIKSAHEYAFEAFAKEVRKFQESLSNQEELGMAVYGGGTILHIETIRREGQVLVFEGVDTQGNRSRILQHFTQLSVHLMAVKKIGDEPRRIGF